MKTRADTQQITTTISFDRSTTKRLKHLAVERECKVRDLIREAVQDLLKKYKEGKS